MKNLISQAEVAFWNTTIALMSREKMPRLYSQTIAALTLRLQPTCPNLRLSKVEDNKTQKNTNILLSQWIHMAILCVLSLAIGLILGWIRSG